MNRQIVIEAPNPQYGPYDVTKVFLGGGISNCPPWHDYFLRRIQGFNCDYTIYNPRRADFDVSDPNQSVIQIKWEHDHLHMSDIIVFWFPCETLCPITLFELGKYCQPNGRSLIVGCHPDYKRKTDVIEQMKLARPGFKVHEDLNDVINELQYALTY